jgi:actin-like ATPase involved in cell morphogenesis
MSIDQAAPRRHALGVDFGTSNTVAVARWPDGRARPILVDGSPLLPSAVYAEPDGQLIAGRDAVHSSRLDPARFEPNPKRRVDDGFVFLGDREVPVVELIGAVLGRVAEEWHRTVGSVPTDVTLTCPATWGATRRTLLAEAAGRAGLAGARLVAEPVAAATYFAEVLGRDVPIGSVVVVHDFGAGTFDASVVARTAEGFEVLAVDGRDDIGGLDVDAAIVEYLQGDEPEWQRLIAPETVADRRAQRQLWDDVRVAKERLSRTQSADLVVPLLNREIHLTRDELEKLARPVLDQTVGVTRRLLRWADLPEGRLAGVFLVGGASRIPLVATLLHRELGEAPVVIEQPELVVAEGSILADAALLASGAAAPGPTAELRLSFAKRAESETVISSVRGQQTPPPPPVEVSGSSGPLAAAGATSGPISSSGSGGLSPVSPGRGFVSGSGSVDDQETVPARPSGSGGYPPPAVDPWPHAERDTWTPDPEQTVATDPAWRIEAGAAATRPLSPAGPSRSPAGPNARQGPGHESSPPLPGRGAGRDGGRQPSAGRPSSSTAGWAAEPQPRPVVARPPAAVRRRRPGGFVRFLQVVLSLLVLVAAPVAALVFAYSFGTGLTLPEAVDQLYVELRNLVHSGIA